MNALIIREIAVKIFKSKNTSMEDATAVSIWISGTTFVFSFMSDIFLLGWLLFVAASGFFVFLVKKYYALNWKKTIYFWLIWLGVYVVIGLIIGFGVLLF